MSEKENRAGRRGLAFRGHSSAVHTGCVCVSCPYRMPSGGSKTGVSEVACVLAADKRVSWSMPTGRRIPVRSRRRLGVGTVAPLSLASLTSRLVRSVSFSIDGLIRRTAVELSAPPAFVTAAPPVSDRALRPRAPAHLNSLRKQRFTGPAHSAGRTFASTKQLSRQNARHPRFIVSPI